MDSTFPIDRLRAIRESRLMKRETLASIVGVSYRTLQRWESGENRPRLRDQIALAKALDYDTTPAQPARRKPSKVA